MPAQPTTSSQPLQDPQALRAIAHPLRARILDELTASGSLRAADVARLLDVPANQASFHLRQLAKYGLVVESPEEARDGRDRVWKAAAPHGYSLDLADLESRPGGAAVVSVWRRHAAARAHAAVEHALAGHGEKGTHSSFSDSTLRLSHDEAVAMTTEMVALVDRYQDRGKQAEGSEDRRTYQVISLLQPYAGSPDGESDEPEGAAD